MTNLIIQNKSFCIMPWIHQHIRPNGEIAPCCTSHDILMDEDKKKFNINENSFSEVFNSTHMIEIRKKMISGEKINGCFKCYYDEEYSGTSKRLIYTSQWMKGEYSDEVKQILVNSIKNKFIVNDGIIYLDLRFGNLCNLKCRSCNPQNSSQIEKEYNKIYKTNSSIEEFAILDGGVKENWYEKEKFWNELNENLKNIKQIYLAGGEPTLIDENYKFLQKLVEQGFHKNIELHFNTNLTNSNPDFLNLISQFKLTRLCISIDGFGKVQEYLRYPSKWKSMAKNLKAYADLPTNVVLRVDPVLQIGNVFSIFDLFKYIDTINLEKGFKRITYMPILVQTPRYLKISLLDDNYKIMLINQMREFLKQSNDLVCNTKIAQAIKVLETETEKDRDNLISQLIRFYTILDKNRNQHLKDFIPELYEFLKKYGY